MAKWKTKKQQKKKKQSHSQADNSSNKQIAITRSRLEALKKEITQEATRKSFVLMMGYMMEDPVFNCDEDKIEEYFLGVERYTQAIEDHYLTLHKVCEIIKERTGIEIGW